MISKRTGLFLFLALAVGAGVLLMSLMWSVWPFRGGFQRFIDAPVVVREVQQLSELVSVKYSVQKVVGLKEDKIPFGTESILLVVEGRVLGGINLGALREQDIEVRGRKVWVRLPPPEILHVYLNEEQTKVWDRRITWWTPWVPFSPDLEQRARLAALDSIKESALEMGLYAEARKSAETAIRGLLRAMGAESVEFAPSS